MKTYKVFHRPKQSSNYLDELFHVVEAKGVIDARNKARSELESDFKASNPDLNPMLPSHRSYIVPRGSEDIFEVNEGDDISLVGVKSSTCDDLIHNEDEVCSSFPCSKETGDAHENEQEEGSISLLSDEDTLTEEISDDEEMSFDDIDFDDFDLSYTVDDINHIVLSLEAGQSVVIHDLDNDVYHAADGYSSSSLKMIVKTPSLFKWMQDCKKHEESSSLSFGTAFHCSVLEPGRFDFEYVKFPKFDRRKKDYKESLEKFEADNAGKKFINGDDFDKIVSMHQSVMSHPDAKKIIYSKEFKSEVSIFWKCPDTYLVFKIRCDGITEINGKHIILDIKTVSDMKRLKYSIVDYGYDMQAAFYSYIYEKAIGVTPVFSFCFASTSLSLCRYEVRVGTLGDNHMQRGIDSYRQAISNMQNYSDELNLEEF